MKQGTLIAFGIVGALVLVTLFSSCTNVQGGYVGVKKTMGSISDTTLSEGPHLILPFFQTITLMDTRLKSYSTDSTSASSKDLQLVTTVISVQHWLNPSTAPLALREVGEVDEFDKTVVSPAVLESLKAVTAKYTAEELVTKRDIVKKAIEDDIKAFIADTLKEKGATGAISVANVAIKDFQFSHEYNEAIEAKVTAQQKVLQAQSDKAKKITDAEATNAQWKLQTDAEAYQVEQKSMKAAAAIEREGKALAANPNLVQLRAIERWSGTLPTYVGTGSATPFLSVTQGK